MSEGLEEFAARSSATRCSTRGSCAPTTSGRGGSFSVEHLEVELSDGSHDWREVVRHHGGAGVVAVLDGRVCLVRQYRVALGRMTLEIPAGKVDPSEPRDVCAARELTEETGLIAERLELLTESYGAPRLHQRAHLRLLRHGLTQGEASLDEGEFLNVVWVPLEDALAAIRAGLIDDAKTVSGILAARRTGCSRMFPRRPRVAEKRALSSVG